MQAETLTSFISGADDSEFPLENIPFGIASTKQTPGEKFAATRIGDFVINLKEVENCGLFGGKLLSALGKKIFQGEVLNNFMALSRDYWREARVSIQELFSADSKLKDNEELQAKLVSKL